MLLVTRHLEGGNRTNLELIFLIEELGMRNTNNGAGG